MRSKTGQEIKAEFDAMSPERQRKILALVGMGLDDNGELGRIAEPRPLTEAELEYGRKLAKTLPKRR